MIGTLLRIKEKALQREMPVLLRFDGQSSASRTSL
jgi:hypothetical protein